MSFKNNEDAFRSWAAKLGCPPDAIPSSEALKTIFKSRQRDLLLNIMNRVRGRQQVQGMRENLLIYKMKLFKDQLVPIGARNLLPKELQIYLKVKDLQKTQKEQEAHLQELQIQYEELNRSARAKNIQSIQLEEQVDQLQARVYLLQLKAEQLDQSVAKENELKQRILSSMPVKITNENVNEIAGIAAIEKAIKELDNFYESNEGVGQISQESKDELWRKLRDILLQVPNFSLYKILLRLKDEQLHYIVELNKPNIEHASENKLTQMPFSKFELKMMYAKADAFLLHTKYLAAQADRQKIEQEFSTVYVTFVNELEEKVKLFNSADNDQVADVISAYILQYNMRNFTQAENEFLLQQLELINEKISSNNIKLEHHELMLGKTKQMYADIDNAIQHIQRDMILLLQIKEKIMHSKNMLQRAFAADMQNTLTVAGPASRLTVPSSRINDTADSFDIIGEDVLCSTKLDDMEHSFAMNQQNLMRASIKVPPHILELKTFADVTLENFSCLRRDCASFYCPNPLIFKVEELGCSTNLAPGILLTSYNALQEVSCNLLWAGTLGKHNTDVKVQLEPITVDAANYKQRLKEQSERIIELLDKIKASGTATEYALQKLEKMYKFIMENPLRQCIPNSQRFNGQTYEDYEREYNMYYRMVQDIVSRT